MDDITPTTQLPLQPLPEPPPSRGLRWVFIGQNGIRAGWGILLFIAIFILVAYLGSRAIRHFIPMEHHGDAPLPVKMGAFFEAFQLGCIVIATGALALIERKSLFAYGFQGAHRVVRFIAGLAWGFIAISVLILTLWKTGYLAFDGQLLHGFPSIKYAAAWGIMFLLVGLSEESLLRGYVQYTFTRGVGFWWGALIFSFLFGFAHHSNAGESPVGLFSAGAVGLVFCLSIWYTGSLWWAVGFHAAWDWGQSYFYGVADSGMVARGHLFAAHPVGTILRSGGLTGPEGSIFIIPLLFIMALGMWFWWGRGRAQSPFADSGWRPAWSRKQHRIENPVITPGTIEAAG